MQVVIAPDSRLRVKTKPVKKITPALLATTKEMIKLTKTFKDPEGVGLASTQVGLDERFFISLIPAPKGKTAKYAAFFNPKIISSSTKLKTHFEGCLSVPLYWGEVQRPISVRASYMDESGKMITKNLTGLLAHIFQHEVDHLDGVIMPDRVMQQKGKFYKWTGKDEETGEDVFQEIKI